MPCSTVRPSLDSSMPTIITFARPGWAVCWSVVRAEDAMALTSGCMLRWRKISCRRWRIVRASESHVLWLAHMKSCGSAARKVGGLRAAAEKEGREGDGQGGREEGQWLTQRPPELTVNARKVEKTAAKTLCSIAHRGAPCQSTVNANMRRSWLKSEMTICTLEYGVTPGTTAKMRQMECRSRRWCPNRHMNE